MNSPPTSLLFPLRQGTSLQKATQLGFHHPSQDVCSMANSFQALVIRQVVQLWQFQGMFTIHRLTNEFKTFLINSHQLHPALLDPVTKRGGKTWRLDHLLLRPWMLQKTLFPPISCPDCFAEISSHLFSSLCRYTPARLHFKSLLVCWFQSSPKSPIIQETDVLDYCFFLDESGTEDGFVVAFLHQALLKM